jgi:salicylate hydroxylase
LKWSGWTAFRAIFDASLIESVPNVPEDSTHWWGPTTTFFASKLGKNTFTVVGGVYQDPEVENVKVVWDQAANIALLRDAYAVSI